MVYYNAAAFAQNCAKTTVTSPCVPIDGNSGRNMLRGPGFKDVDLAVFRDFTFKERYAIQARLASLNVFNMVSLNNPTGNGATAGSTTLRFERCPTREELRDEQARASPF
jgi:hypothetical protein